MIQYDVASEYTASNIEVCSSVPNFITHFVVVLFSFVLFLMTRNVSKYWHGQWLCVSKQVLKKLGNDDSRPIIDD